MIFYEIELKGTPKISIACSVEYERYRNHFSNPRDYLEICLCEQGRIVFEQKNGEKIIAYPGDLIPAFSDTECVSYAYKGERQKHTTVAVNVPYSLKRYSSESKCDIKALEQRIKNNCTILIPCYESMGDSYNEILYMLKKICVYAYSDTPGGSVRALAEWYRLAARLTEFVFLRLSAAKLALIPSEISYADKAAKLIADNYMRRLTVSDIAAEIGISEGYLHRVFRKVKNMGVIEYLNKYRISVAIELINVRGLSLKEAAQNTGIDDPAYMSRVFKKITGLSCREYMGNVRMRKK